MKNSALFVLCALLTACGGSDDNKTTNQTTIQSYTITTNVEGEGQLQPTSLVLKQGESGTFELQPEQGHQVASVEGCNGTYSNNIYTIENAAQSCQVTAKFEARAINVTFKSDEYISLYADQNDYVYGDSVVINYELSSGYLLDEITGCNGVLNGELYKVDALTTDCQITATTLPTSQLFSGEDEAQVNVTVLDGKGSILSSSKGVIEPSNPKLPALNSSLEFERDLLAVDIATEAGQTIELQIAYENSLPTQFTYQKLIDQQWQALDQENVAVSEDRLTLTLTLTDGGAGDSDGVINGVIKDPGGPAVVKMHTVTINQSAGGAITPESLAVAHGDTALFTISTDAGYTLESVTGCNGNLNGTSYQTAAITQNCEISAEYSLTSFLVTAQAGEGGQISPLEQLASYGDTLRFTVTADDDQNIESVQGCNGSLAGNIYTTGVITGECEVRATFDPQIVLVTAQAGMGGSISPMSQELNIGQQASLIVTPNEGYSIANVTGCSGSLNGNTYTTSAVTANCQVQASFSIDSYTLSASAGEGGTVNPATQNVNHGSSAQITITPNEGYSIDGVTGCSGSLNGNTYTTSAVTANCQVQASFSINSYTVSSSAGEGGAVSPATQSVNHGSSAQITITPKEGYSIDAVTGCSGSLNGNTYTTGAVTANCQVQASFSINSYTVSASAGEGGAVTPTAQSVNYGSSAQVSVTTDEGYMIERVYGCEGGLVESVFTTGLITSQCSVTAEFKIIPKAPIITAQASVQSITVSWDSLDNIAGYTLYHATSEAITPDNYNDFGGVKVEFDTSTTTHELTNLQSNTTYYIIMTSHITGTESDVSNKLAITTQINITIPLNDTGITWCADDINNNLDCPVTGYGYGGQDAEHGRDAKAKAGTLKKVGGGNAGFDLTKLDVNGNDLPESATTWSCVRDNHTGLIWEVKTDDGGLHDKNDRYNWYNPNSNSNGGSPGYQDYGGDICYGYDVNNEASYCNTFAYVERVNIQSLCGASDWRMPTRLELMGIVDNGTKNPAIDTQYFPQTRSSLFWSSSPYAEIIYGAWSVDFGHGIVRYVFKDDGFHVRLVRARP
ncbi:MAG: InlB B-repeat-containing protein [Pseudoalteromonas prydzensis]|uniref:InlB B-repeat-containing protein n=1 Tax=Pseudoalteromonas prydzensis TaxID=182141 RepID=UPI003F986CE9